MTNQTELDRTIRYVLIRVECVERTDYENFDHNNNNNESTSSTSSSKTIKRYSYEELNDEIEALNHVRMNLNDFINRNQDLTVDQLCILKELKHRLFGAIDKLKIAAEHLLSSTATNKSLTLLSPSSSTSSNNNNNNNDHLLQLTSSMSLKSPKKNFSNNKSNNNNNSQRNYNKNNNKHQQQHSNNGKSMNKNHLNANNDPLAFGGTDCSTMIRFFVNQINKNNPDICYNSSISDINNPNNNQNDPFGLMRLSSPPSPSSTTVPSFATNPSP